MNGLEIHNSCIAPVSRMELNGVHVNRDLAKKSLLQCISIKKGMEEAWINKYGSKYTGSNKYLKEFFDSRGWGYILKKLTESEKAKGKIANPDFSQETLLTYKHLPQGFTRHIGDIRSTTARIGLYKSISESEGIMYTKYGDAITGRFRSSSPNVQNFPKVSFRGSPRDCIVPPHPSYSFVALDYSQGEYRLFADFVGNKKIIDRLNGGEDFHLMTAMNGGVTRQEAKKVNFAILYGAGIETLALALNCKPYKAIEIREKVMESFGYSAREYIFRTSNSYVISKWSGLDIYVRDSWKRVNYHVQGGLADIVRKSMCLLHEYLNEKNLNNKVELYLNVHDENVFWFSDILSKDERNFHIENIKNIMENSYASKNGLKMKVDVSISKEGYKSLDKGSFDEYKTNS